MNTEAAEAFWEWFEKNEQWIIDNSQENGQDVVWEIDEHIVPVFPYMPEEDIEFQFGYNNGEGVFEFYHLGDKRLMRDGEILKGMMPESLASRWTFEIFE
ncbi:MAG: hypothetical protein PUB87_09120 [Eubacteriaceae bacterium]|nr:hypothetical protein [Eubacteriaceae bacterium]